jgi:hypothetical protein
MWHKSQRIGALLGVVALCCLGEGQAQEFCVSCTEPKGLYRCIIEGARPGGGSLQALCTTTVARDGGHASCSIKGGTVFDCNGTVKRIPWKDTSVQSAPEAGASPATTPAVRPNRTATKSTSGEEEPPKTVVEMAKRANEKTAEQMKKAGEDMKEATKKTWDCMVSFFTRC